MLQLKPFHYIRHGETDWNLERRCMGQQDIPLNSTGLQQSQAAKILLSLVKIETICYSPLTRTKQTAEIINETLECPLISIPNLKECNLGVLEGQIEHDHAHLNSWLNGVTPSGAETYANFLHRVFAGINEALSYPNPLIVAHGAVYWALLNGLGKEYAHFSIIPNAIPVFYQPPASVNEPWLIKSL